MQSYDDILTRLRPILQAHARSAVVVEETTQLTSDLELDSAQLLELVLEIEEAFDISVPLNILPEIQTVRDLALQLEALLEQPS